MALPLFFSGAACRYSARIINETSRSRHSPKGGFYHMLLRSISFYIRDAILSGPGIATHK